MKRLEEEVTPHFLALADAAKANTSLTLSRAEAKCLARRTQVLALTHELTARGPRIRVRDRDRQRGWPTAKLRAALEERFSKKASADSHDETVTAA